MINTRDLLLYIHYVFDRDDVSVDRRKTVCIRDGLEVGNTKPPLASSIRKLTSPGIRTRIYIHIYKYIKYYTVTGLYALEYYRVGRAC